MRTFSGPKSHDDPARQKVHGCTATNLAVPGLGSLVGGRKVGWLQIVLYLTGFAMTVGFGIRFVYWSIAHWSEYHSTNIDMDPFQPLRDLWQQARWPMLGIALCLVSWFWALQTSRSLLAGTKPKTPPVLATAHEK
jgi:hypothetical protein